MATYLSEIKNETLYKRKFFLPINEEDKRHNSLIFLLGNNLASSYDLRKNSFTINLNKSFISYYMEPNVKYYMNIRENEITSEYEDINIINEACRTKEEKNDLLLSENLIDNEDIYFEESSKSVMDKNFKKKSGGEFEYLDIHSSKAQSYLEDDHYYNKHFKNIKSDINGEIVIDKEKDKLAGYIYIGSKGKNKGFIQSLEVIKEYRGYGLSNKLLEDAIHKYNAIDLTVYKDNEVAVNLYKKHNFVIIGNGNTKDKDYWMKLRSKLSKDDTIMKESYSISLDKKYKPEFNLSENSFMLSYNDMDTIIDEASPYDNRLKQMLYKDRIKSNKEALKIYRMVRENDKMITKTYLNIDRYNGLNLFSDLYYYNNLFLKNVKLAPLKANDMYFSFILNLLKDERYDGEYFVKTVFIPVKKHEYESMCKKNTLMWDYRNNVNIIAALAKAIREDNSSIRKLNGYTFVFLGNNGYFKTNKIADIKYPRFITLIRKLYNKEIILDDGENKDSPKAIKTYIINDIENSKSVEINNLVGNTPDDKTEIQVNDIKTSADAENKNTKVEKDKEEIVKVVDDYSKKATSVDDALDKINNSDLDSAYFKEVLKDLENNAPNNVKIDATRAARMNDVNNKFLRKKVEGKTVQELINQSSENTPLPVTELQIDSVNEEWKNLQGANFEKAYDLDEDITAIIYSLSSKTYPISILDIKKEDTSTSEDHIYTYTVNCEDSFGQRFTLKFDIPKFRNDRFMRLKGNEKTLNGQLLLLPVIKTDEDTVQIVTSYKKIFIRRYGESVGKSIPQADAVMKALEKYKGNNVKVIYGDTRRICSKYELPIDYLDFSKVYSKIIIKGSDNYEIYFNQDELREKYKVDDSKGVPFAVMNNKQVIYYSGQGTISGLIQAMLGQADSTITELMDDASRRKKYTYSMASILNSKIPLIVVMAYSEGLVSSLEKAKIEYTLSEKRPRIPVDHDIIKFNDGYLMYRVEYDSSLLLNGLKDCDTENYSIKDINNKDMWTDFLDLFGGRIKADGLDNFYDLTMDPITVDICKIYDLPTDYIELLAYANSLLADNKYNKHVDITGNRYRTNEQIAAIFYEALCESYEQYRLQIKNGRNKPVMTIKQSAVIDKLMEQPTFSDLSVFSPVLEYEAANAVSFKGKSGMNSDRSYGLDKRIYDESMVNVLALSTGFAGNVGLTRQTTIDKNIEGKRGLIKQSRPEDMNTTKALCMTEALTPFGSTHDDPFRSAMTFVQTSKHGMRTAKQSPLLITNGADMALPYLCSDMFAFKAKNKGKVKEITKDYMIIEYADGQKDFIDLRENIKKNSDGGVFEVLKLDTDLKVGDTIKQGQVLAYDKKSFVSSVGTGDLSTSVGILSKIAILETDEGYEDSAIISERLSENLMSQVVIQKPVLLDAKTNVYKMIKKGTKVNVGDSLITIQNAFDDEDANLLLKTITDEELISDAGRIPITSKITGVVQDIKIYRSCELNEMSDSLRKVVSTYESDIKKLKKAAAGSIGNAETNLEPDYKLSATGKLKNSPNHVLIEFYLRYDDKMSVGDKIVYYSALKGVTKDIFPKGKEPRSEFRPEEPIDTMLSVESINGRMVGSIISTGCINKILIELARKSREIMGLPKIDEFE